MIFRYDISVNSHSCDYNGVLRPSALMTYLQEAANLQLKTYGPSYEEMKASGQYFVLSRIGVMVYEPIYSYDTLVGETCALPSRGFSFLRHHRLLRGGKAVCQACSVWALLRSADKRPLRVEEYHPNFTTEAMEDITMPDRVRVQSDHLSLLGKYTVRYADTDQNEHMNNTAYADMLCGFLDLHGQYVSRFSINYYHEAPLGTGLSVYGQSENDGEHLFRSLRADGETNVEAAFSLSPLS